MKLARKEFLRRAGLGSIALASLPALADVLTTPAGAAQAEEERVFYLVSFSKAKNVDHRVALSGAGGFNSRKGTARGWGTFVHIDNSPPGTPKPLIASGRWRVTKFVSYGHEVGKYGSIRPSIVELLVDLMPEGKPVVTGATLRLICNVGAAGLLTGEPEGFTLTIPGTQDAFAPLDPVLGLTHIGVA